MKSIKFLSFVLALVMGLSSCSSSWLDTDTTGSTLTQEQYDNLPNTAEGAVLGLYSMLYATAGGSNHHYFGQKSIDMATDILSGDMAMTANAYGWFVDCEQQQCSSMTAGRNSYFWSYYYTILLNANAAIRSFVALENPTDAQKAALAQCLTMRAYCYFNLAHLYSPGMTDTESQDRFVGNTGMDYLCVPLYNETSSVNEETGLVQEQPVASTRAVYDQVISDLNWAVALFDETGFQRSSKLYLDKDIANAYLAYTYLQTQEFDSAYTVAKRVIDAGNYEILPFDDLTTTGFVDQSNPSWMWGLDVTIENTTHLASFWAHLDVHTYGYAALGAAKALDDELYKSIPETDGRINWFDKSKKCIPSYKFYDLARGTNADEYDRRWLNDLVFMRIEEMYLVAAEAAARADKLAEAKEELKVLLAQRDETVMATVDGMSKDELLSNLYYNWRIEMFGEGRALMTFKRFGGMKTRGNNHFYKGGETMQAVDPANPILLFIIPYSEYTNNQANNDLKN